MTISSLDTLTFTFTPAENNVELWMQESDPQAMGYWQFNWAEEYDFLFWKCTILLNFKNLGTQQ